MYGFRVGYSPTVQLQLSGRPVGKIVQRRALKQPLSRYRAIKLPMDRMTTEALSLLGKLTQTDKNLFAGRQFLNPHCIQDLGNQSAPLREALEAARPDLHLKAIAARLSIRG